MNKRIISLLNVPLSLSPDRTFTLLGIVNSIDVQLKCTEIIISIVDWSDPRDNVSQFKVVFTENIKSLFDKLVKKGNLIHITGEIESDINMNITLIGKHFFSYDGGKCVWEITTPGTLKVDNSIDPSWAY